MDFISRKEQDIFKNEQYTLECEKNAEINRFRDQLLGEMGETMLNELSSPPKPNKWLGFKYKLKKFKENLDLLFGLNK